MAQPPSGTLTFLFTDIEGSTREWERDAAEMRAALARHDAILRAAIEHHGGYVFKTVGDAFCAAFASAVSAVSATVVAQRALRDAFEDAPGGPSRVRMAVHSGEAEARDGDYFGRVVNRVARLLAAGHGRQILVSGATRELLLGNLPESASLRDLGEHLLKDLERPEHVFQLDHPEFPADFPPLRSLSALPHNLPQQLTSFVGREREVARLRELLSAHRLVTLTGVGGSGKTRLALHVAADVVDQFPDGVWLVDLSALSDPALVPQTVAATLGSREAPGRDPVESLLAHLRTRDLLLVLDNCEHLIEACAAWAERALRAVPGLRVLATSREALGTMGELIWPVPSLSVPDLSSGSREDLWPVIDRYEAVRLFAERATLVDPGFDLTAADARAVVQICRRLDGIPLAIELAAARVRVLAPEQIASRLDDRFRLLSGGGRRVLPRHRTLQAAIDWSYDLLEEPERVLLRRVSVFSGGWPLEGAEAVCAGEAAGDLEPADVLDLLSRLVEKSLVIADRSERGRVRYRMLETTRQYAQDKLVEAGEAEAIRSRHAAWCLALVEELAAEAERGGAPESESLDSEYDNVRAALDWSLGAGGSAQAALRVAGSLYRFWRMRGLLREGADWLERSLAATAETPDAVRVRALAALSAVAYFRGDMDRAQWAGERALAVARTLADRRSLLRALVSLSRVGLHSEAEGEFARGLAATEEGLTLARELGDRRSEMVLLTNLGERLREQGDLEGARRTYEEALPLVDGQPRLAILFNLGEVALVLLDPKTAEARYREACDVNTGHGDRMSSAYQVLGMGQVAAARSDHVRAARLLAAAEAAFERFGERLTPVDQSPYQRSVVACRQALGDAAFEAAWAKGRALDLERAVAEAFGGEAAARPPSQPGSA